MQFPKAVYLGDKNGYSVISIPKVYKVEGVKTIYGNKKLNIKLPADNEVTVNLIIEAINEKLERDFNNGSS